MTSMVGRATGIAIALAGALQAAPAAAQQIDVEKATELEKQAAALYTQPDRYTQAARLHVRAAQLRPAGDPEQVTDLTMAARLHYYAGNIADALRFMSSAASAAHASGDVVNAAERYMDASHLAFELGRRDAVEQFTEQARLLTFSPLIADEKRDDLRARIETGRVVSFR